MADQSYKKFNEVSIQKNKYADTDETKKFQDGFGRALQRRKEKLEAQKPTEYSFKEHPKDE